MYVCVYVYIYIYVFIIHTHTHLSPNFLIGDSYLRVDSHPLHVKWPHVPAHTPTHKGGR